MDFEAPKSQPPAQKEVRSYAEAVKNIQDRLLPKLNRNGLIIADKRFRLAPETAKKKHGEIITALLNSLKKQTAEGGHKALTAENFDTEFDEEIGLNQREFADFLKSVENYITKRFIANEGPKAPTAKEKKEATQERRVRLTGKQVRQCIDALNSANNYQEWQDYSKVKEGEVFDQREINKQLMAPIAMFCKEFAKPIEAQIKMLEGRINELRKTGFFAFAGPSNIFGLAKDAKGRTRFEAELDGLRQYKSRQLDLLLDIRNLQSRLSKGLVKFGDLASARYGSGGLKNSAEGDLIFGIMDRFFKGEFTGALQNRMFYDYYISKGSEYKRHVGDFGEKTADGFFDKAKDLAKKGLKDPNLAKRAEQMQSSGWEKFRRDYLVKYAEPFVRYDGIVLMLTGGAIGNALAKSTKIVKLGARIKTSVEGSRALTALSKFVPGVKLIGEGATVFGKEIPKVVSVIANITAKAGQYLGYQAAAEKLGGKKFAQAVAYALMFIPGTKAGFKQGLASRQDYAKFINQFKASDLEKKIIAGMTSKLAEKMPSQKLGSKSIELIKKYAKKVVTRLRPSTIPLSKNQQKLAIIAAGFQKGKEVVINGSKYIFGGIRKGAKGAHEFIVRKSSESKWIAVPVQRVKNIYATLNEPAGKLLNFQKRVKRRTRVGWEDNSFSIDQLNSSPHRS